MNFLVCQIVPLIDPVSNRDIKIIQPTLIHMSWIELVRYSNSADNAPKKERNTWTNFNAISITIVDSSSW